jgi:acyl carrier protein
MVDDLERVMAIVCEVGKIPAVRPDEDIYEAGFSSVNALELLIELESALEVSIPDDRFINARSVRAICAIIERSKREQAA